MDPRGTEVPSSGEGAKYWVCNESRESSSAQEVGRAPF